MAAEAAAARGRRTPGLIRHARAAIALGAAFALASAACGRRVTPADPKDFHLTIGVAADSAGRPRIESSLVARGAWAELVHTTLGPEEAARVAPGALLVERFTAPPKWRQRDGWGDWVFDFVLYETRTWRARRARGAEPYGVEVAASEYHTVVYERWRGGWMDFAPPPVRNRFDPIGRHLRTMVTLIENGRVVQPWDDSGLLVPPAGEPRAR